MKKNRLLQVFLVSTLLLALPAAADEEEEATPLTIGVQGDYGNINKVRVRLNGSRVEVTVNISNKSNLSKRLGFFAYTPFFRTIGIGEANQNKTFTGLKVFENEKIVNLTRVKRGFFMGKDITAHLRKFGLDPLPSIEPAIPTRLPNGLMVNSWQGYVAYSWTVDLRPLTEVAEGVTYHALPQFGRDEVTADRLARLVSQHCGDIGKVRNILRSEIPNIDYILFDRYEISMEFLKLHQVELEVLQASNQSSGKHPIMSLTCGLASPTTYTPNLAGTVADAENIISVFIISSFPGSVIEKDKNELK
jgi:hypothetical protein